MAYAIESRDAEWITIESNKVSRSSITYHLNLDTTNKLSGKLFLTANNYAAQQKRMKYQAAVNEKELIGNIGHDKVGLSIRNYHVSNLDEPQELLEEDMDVLIEDNVEAVENFIYFTPLMYDRTKKNPFILEERNFPVDFAYPTEEIYMMVVEYPKNYRLEKLPVSTRFKMTNGVASFTIVYTKEENNQVVISSKISITKSIFTKDEYYDLKELFKNIVTKQAEQILFRKMAN